MSGYKNKLNFITKVNFLTVYFLFYCIGIPMRFLMHFCIKYTIIIYSFILNLIGSSNIQRLNVEEIPNLLD